MNGLKGCFNSNTTFFARSLLKNTDSDIEKYIYAGDTILDNQNLNLHFDVGYDSQIYIRCKNHGCIFNVNKDGKIVKGQSRFRNPMQ